jgi:hypothetical protein
MEKEVVSVHTMKTYKGSKGIGSLTLNRSTTQNYVVKFTPQLLDIWERTMAPTEQKAGCTPVILSILEKTASPVSASIQTLHCPGHSLVAAPARLSLFSCKYRNSDIHTILTIYMFLQLDKKHYTVQSSWDPKQNTVMHIIPLDFTVQER